VARRTDERRQFGWPANLAPVVLKLRRALKTARKHAQASQVSSDGVIVVRTLSEATNSLFRLRRWFFARPPRGANCALVSAGARRRTYSAVDARGSCQARIVQQPSA